MGLRFRKSVTLCKGIRLNFGKTGASITTGVKGFHNTYNLNTGKVTTSVGIPGTGIYYTSTSGGSPRKNKIPSSENSFVRQGECANIQHQTSTAPQIAVDQPANDEKQINENSKSKISSDVVDSVYRVCDEKIDWFELLSSLTPTDDLFSPDAWNYLHNMAYKVCNGDTDAYLEVVEAINPYDDMLDYCENFECGIDDSGSFCVSFSIKPSLEYENDEVRDNFAAACIIRVARDTFSLLPVTEITINCIDSFRKSQSCVIRVSSLKSIKYRFSDPQKVLSFISQNRSMSERW